jgi:CBS domain-containing protein
MATIVEQLLMHKGRNFWSVRPDASVADAVFAFGEHGIGAVLVCRGPELLGVLSERDCIRKLLFERVCTLDSMVSEVMRTGVATVTPSDTIQHCMGLMNDRCVRHLPVVQDGYVVGVISMGDVINALIREQEYVIESLEGYISGSPSVRPSAH